MFNFWGTIAVDALGIGLAFFGLLAPIIAALIHVSSELAFFSTQLDCSGPLLVHGIMRSEHDHLHSGREHSDHEDHHDHSHSGF
jgi:hypothetical protein